MTILQEFSSDFSDLLNDYDFTFNSTYFAPQFKFFFPNFSSIFLQGSLLNEVKKHEIQNR